jgi:hypothetical protein
MSGLRFRRTKSLGHGAFVTVTKNGPRVGWRSKGRPGVTVSEGEGGLYASARLAKGLWYVMKRGQR